MKKKTITPGSYVRIKSVENINNLCDYYGNNYVYKRTMREIANNVYCVISNNNGYLKLADLHDTVGHYGPYFYNVKFPFSVRTSFVDCIANPDIVPAMFGVMEPSYG